MIKFESFASSSSGNCYSISDGNSRIMIECGLPIKAIQKHFNHQLSAVDACLVTHGHL